MDLLAARTLTVKGKEMHPGPLSAEGRQIAQARLV